MKVQEINIRMQKSYEPDAGQYRGTVTLADESSSQNIRISSRGLTAIFRVIKEDVAAEAMRIASATPNALTEAEHAPLLLENGDF